MHATIRSVREALSYIETNAAQMLVHESRYSHRNLVEVNAFNEHVYNENAKTVTGKYIEAVHVLDAKQALLILVNIPDGDKRRRSTFEADTLSMTALLIGIGANQDNEGNSVIDVEQDDGEWYVSYSFPTIELSQYVLKRLTEVSSAQ